MSTYSAGPHYVSCDECGRDTPRFKDMARLMASIRGWDFDRPSESHRCPDCGGTGAITRENSALEVETLRAQVQAVREVLGDRTLDRIDGWNDALDIVEQALDGAK